MSVNFSRQLPRSCRVSTGTGLAQPMSGNPVVIDDQRKHDGADHIDVHGGIERHPAEQACGRIAEPIGRPGVRGFVNAEREHEDREADQNLGKVEVRQECVRLTHGSGALRGAGANSPCTITIQKLNAMATRPMPTTFRRGWAIRTCRLEVQALFAK